MKLTSEVHPPARSVSMSITLVGLVILATWAGYRTVIDSAHPDPRALRFVVESWEYPATSVIASLAVMVLELAAASALLRARRTSPAVRTAALIWTFGALAVLAFPFALGCYRAGDAVGMHVLWLVFAAAWSTVMTVVALIESVARRNRP